MRTRSYRSLGFSVTRMTIKTIRLSSFTSMSFEENFEYQVLSNLYQQIFVFFLRICYQCVTVVLLPIHCLITKEINVSIVLNHLFIPTLDLVSLLLPTRL